MLNFRKLKQDYSPAVLKEGRGLYEKKMILNPKIIKLNLQAVRLSCRVSGNYENAYQCEIEIDRRESTTIESDCDCPYKYDCHHLAAFLFYLEEHFDEIVVAYSKETDLEKTKDIDEKEKATLRAAFKEAESKEIVRKGRKHQKELQQEYVGASQVLGQSPFFHPEEMLVQDKAELAVIFTSTSQQIFGPNNHLEIQLALRLPFRSKPLTIPNVKEFFDAVRYHDSLYIGSKRYFFTLGSFDETSAEILKMIMDFGRFPDLKEERGLRIVQVEIEAVGTILARAYELALVLPQSVSTTEEGETVLPAMPCFYCGSLEEPLRFSTVHGSLRFELEYFEAPAPKILLKPEIILDSFKSTKPEESCFFECAKPGMVHRNTYFRFQPHIKRKHLRNLAVIRDMTIPEPLFGTFVENSLPELMRFAEVSNRDIIERFVTLPFVGPLKAECDIHYLNGELEASLHFIYDDIKVPAASSQLTVHHIFPFVTPQGILARNLTEEQKIIEDLFQDFVFDPMQGLYKAKNEKKIVEFMTEVIPRNQHRVKFNCPENLLDQFIYDESHFKLKLRETERIDIYEVDLKVDGHLNGTTVDQLWECLSAKRAFIELAGKKPPKRKGTHDASSSKMHKILVLDLEKLAPVVQIFDEIGINRLDNHKEERPLWSLASIDEEQFEGLAH